MSGISSPLPTSSLLSGQPVSMWLPSLLTPASYQMTTQDSEEAELLGWA